MSADTPDRAGNAGAAAEAAGAAGASAASDAVDSNDVTIEVDAAGLADATVVVGPRPAHIDERAHDRPHVRPWVPAERGSMPAEATAPLHAAGVAGAPALAVPPPALGSADSVPIADPVPVTDRSGLPSFARRERRRRRAMLVGYGIACAVTLAGLLGIAALMFA